MQVTCHPELRGGGVHRETARRRRAPWPLAISDRYDRLDMIDQRDREDSAEKSEAAEPIERTEKTDPTEPNEKADPTEPMDKNEPLEAMERTESSDHSDQREDEPAESSGQGFTGAPMDRHLVLAARSGKTLPTFDSMYWP